MLQHQLRMVGVLFACGMLLLIGFDFVGPTDFTRAAGRATASTTITSEDWYGPETQKAQGGVAVARSIPDITQAQACALPAPTLVAPINGAVSRDLVNPLYTFRPIAEANEYIYQVATSSDFADPLITDSGGGLREGDVKVFASFLDLNSLTTYFWRMASVCADGTIGVFSEPATFTTGERITDGVCTLPPPNPLSPDSGATVDTLIPENRWENSSRARENRYELSSDPTFSRQTSSVVFFGLDPNQAEILVEQPNDNLEPNTTYYWRVASICAEIDTRGAFGPARSFTVGAVTGPFPAPPALIAPGNAATVGSIRVNFSFAASEGADTYRISFYRSLEDAQNDRVRRSLTTSDTQATVVFNPDETWFWRTNARNDKGWGSFSEIRSFRTPVAEASATITPEQGGTLSPDPGFLTVTFPPGAVSAPTELRFELLNTPSQPLPNLRFANRVFTVKAFAGETPITQFAQPFTMVLSYEEADLVEAGISDPAELNLVFWDGNAWVPILPCEGCAIDPTARTITIVLDHLTEFALVGPAPTANLQVFLPLVQR